MAATATPRPASATAISSSVVAVAWSSSSGSARWPRSRSASPAKPASASTATGCSSLAAVVSARPPMRQSPRTEPEGREKEEDLSHIHVPDGVLPLWLVAVGWLATALVLALCLRRVPADDWTRRLALLGVIAALMVVGMTVEIVPIGYHLNLTVVAGIVLGPALGFIAAFIVNAILAMFGHSGVTVIGLNTLVIGSEVAVGYLLFRA